MKNAAKIILTILFIPLFLIFLIFTTLRFQILDANFWLTTFGKNNVYSDLAVSIKNYTETLVTSEGGNKSDVRVLTDLVTPDNLKDFINRNIINLLSFANGKTKELLVYFPVTRIPKGLLPAAGKISELTPLPVLLKDFNVQGIPESLIQNIVGLGYLGSLGFLISLILVLIIAISLYLLSDKGKRLTASGISLFITGIVIVFITVLGLIIRTGLTKSLTLNNNLGEMILGIVISPVLKNVFAVWSWFGGILIVLGIVLLFLRKYKEISLKK